MPNNFEVDRDANTDAPSPTCCSYLKRCSLGQFLFEVIYIASLVALPFGIGIQVYLNKLGHNNLYRSGYVCGTEPPTKEDIAARNDMPACLSVENSYEYPMNQFYPLCLQASGLDKPAVWCNDGRPYRTVDYGKDDGVRPISPVAGYASTGSENYVSYGYGAYLWWSQCDKCGTGWRIFKTMMDDDQSWYKRLTSAQSNNTALPPEDEWLYWSDYSSEWLDIDMNITSCSTLEAAANSSWDTIPSSCFSDAIYVGVNPWSNAASSLLIIGGIFWFLTLFCGCLKCINPRHCPLNRFPDKDDDSRDDYGHITICCGYLLCKYRVGEQEVAAD